MAKYTPKKKKQLRRIRRFIKAAEKRGYQFGEDLISNLTSFSTQKLKSLTSQKLYKQATYKIGDETVTGEKGRKIERTVAAKKGARTKARRKRAKEEYKRWEEEQRRIDLISLSDFQEEEPYIPQFTDIILSNITDLVQQARTDSWERARRNSYIVQGYLDNEISIYGRDTVAMACEQATEDLIAIAKDALYQYNEDKCKDLTLALVMVIRGYIPTVEESKQFTKQA